MGEKLPGAIRHALDKVLKKGGNKRGPELPALAEAIEHFIGFAGGTQAFAKMLWDEWLTQKPGSIARQRILELITRTWRMSEIRAGGNEDLGLLSEEDLERELDRRLAKLTEGARGQEEATPAAGPGQPAAASTGAGSDANGGGAAAASTSPAAAPAP